MTYAAVRARLATRVSTRFTQTVDWGSGCPSGFGAEKRHWQQVAWPTFGIDENFEPARCDHCGDSYDGSKIWRGCGSHHVYDTPDGMLHPGDTYWAPDPPHSEGGSWRPAGWRNCDGTHLHAVLPNGHHWDIDGRASNCTLPDDREHRCWVRHGEPPNVTVDKNGRTCSAGAGSILSGDYHGFLRDGSFTAG